MAKAPSRERTEARRLYLASDGRLRPKEIADQLHLPESTVRGWKFRDRWDDEIKTAHKGKRAKLRNVSAPKRGGKPGNKNAKGAPCGPRNGNYRHGGYSRVFWDALSAEERELLGEELDEEEALIAQIQLYSIRERRLLFAVAKYKDELGGVSVSDVTRLETKRVFADEEEQAEYERLRLEKKEEGKISYYGREYALTTRTEANVRVYLALERELSAVQAAKTKAIDALARLGMAREKLLFAKERLGMGDQEQLRKAMELLGGVDSAF